MDLGYRSVRNRCALDLSKSLPVSGASALDVLKNLGFKEIKIDVVSLARGCIGKSIHRRGASLKNFPNVLDCSGLIKWVYGQKGIWLPRLAIQQRSCGAVVGISEVCAGDAIFMSGRNDYYDTDPSDGVGHVGLATGEGSVVHSVGSSIGTVEVSLHEFLKGKSLRGVRRYISDSMVTLEFPDVYDIECSNDLKWILVIQNSSS